jgi:hypothetical protein
MTPSDILTTMQEVAETTIETLEDIDMRMSSVAYEMSEMKSTIAGLELCIKGLQLAHGRDGASFLGVFERVEDAPPGKRGDFILLTTGDIFYCE